MLQEWWGINEHIKDVTRRVAQAGYVALAPDLYKGQVATEPDEGAPHSFFNDTRESYRPEAASDAWEQMLAWLEKYLP